jgi:hypothetical protein
LSHDHSTVIASVELFGTDPAGDEDGDVIGHWTAVAFRRSGVLFVQWGDGVEVDASWMDFDKDEGLYGTKPDRRVRARLGMRESDARGLHEALVRDYEDRR